MAQMDREGLETLRRGIEAEQRYYPETFHKIVIVRAPWAFTCALSAARARGFCSVPSDCRVCPVPRNNKEPRL